MRICDLFRRRKAIEPTSCHLITSEMAAREYAWLRCVRRGDYVKLDDYLRQGRLVFADMSRFDDGSRRQTMDAFSERFIAPLVKPRLLKRFRAAWRLLTGASKCKCGHLQ